MTMSKPFPTILCVVLVATGMVLWSAREMKDSAPSRPPDTDGFAGSHSCRECHEKFYELWAPSHHGKAMQPMTKELAKQLVPLSTPLQVGKMAYRVDLDKLQMVDSTGTTLPMVHAMGGKNTFFFLTPMKRGRLQVMPLSFNVRTQMWYDTTKSMVRHFADLDDEAIDWRDPLLTFNTACHNCHVSQLSKNYDPITDTYHTTWREPGINCEACHGPSEAHIQTCKAAPSGTPPADLKIKSWKDFTLQQSNDACAPCHAKARPLTGAFTPGDRFFDHYDLALLEDRDYYPDGRDLGENYTQTSWMMSPCVKSGQLNCTHCHTSSGRYRFKGKPPGSACLPCHKERVKTAAAHTHHKADTEGSPTCVSCHMTMTEFGRMNRSDHSMRPPCPEATLQFKSPNACNQCHTNKSAPWAAGQVATWHPASTWQSRILRGGSLIEAARKHNWEQLPKMITYIREPKADAVVVASLLRLLGPCSDESKWPVIRACMDHASPLVRGTAARVLVDDAMSANTSNLLLAGMEDDYRVVRIAAAASFSRVPRDWLNTKQRRALQAAEREMMASYELHPDMWEGYYNKGNHLADRNNLPSAMEAYRMAMKRRPDVIPPYVNAAILSAQMNQPAKALRLLKQAHDIDAENGGVNLNLGLGLAEAGDMAGAERHLLLAMKQASTRAQAAFNLAVIKGANDPAAGVTYCRTAVESEPRHPRYAYTLGFYLLESGNTAAAIEVLEKLVKQQPRYTDAIRLLQNARQR